MKTEIFQILMAVIPTVMTAILGYIGVVVKSIHLNNKASDKAITILLRRELTELYEQYKDKEFLTVDEVDDFDEIYETYASLGGNGKGTMMHDKVHKMEIR